MSAVGGGGIPNPYMGNPDQNPVDLEKINASYKNMEKTFGEAEDQLTPRSRAVFQDSMAHFRQHAAIYVELQNKQAEYIELSKEKARIIERVQAREEKIQAIKAKIAAREAQAAKAQAQAQAAKENVPVQVDIRANEAAQKALAKIPPV